MRRVSHELGSLAQRFGVLAEQLEQEMHLTEETWKDERGQAFLREHLSPFKPTVSQLTASLHQAHELFEMITKKLSDPDRS